MKIKINDFVTIKNENNVVYIIEKIIENQNKVYLRGFIYRIKRVVDVDDVEIASIADVNNAKLKTEKYYNKMINSRKRDDKNTGNKYLLGKILHIDGDETYLLKCLELYESLNIFANGISIKEKDMQDRIGKLIMSLNPDVVVITGHDLYNDKGKKDIDNYTNTRYFINTIKAIRNYKSSYDCAIVAGACQSNFEALIANGADFASSPERINIHTFDPAVIAIKIASTSITKIVNMNEALKYIENGKSAFGGVESFGKMRLLI